mgnify:CR=1 FL=1
MEKIGVIGGGQLARMMIPAAINLGLDIKVFAETDGSSASLAATQVGDYRDVEQVRLFSADRGVLTFDHEHVPMFVLKEVALTGCKIYPAPDALALTHNKIVMRERLAALGLPQPLWAVLSREDDDSAFDTVGGFPCVAKKPVGGYDGKGVRVITGRVDIEEWLDEGPVLLEEKVPFVRELALLSARSPSEEWLPWAPVETRQRAGVCSEVLAPAPDMSELLIASAHQLSRSVAEGVGIVGVLAVEVFELHDGSLVINELAMRPHNSGHVLTELSRTSQFEQHLRAIADLPLGSTSFTSEMGVMVNVFGGIEPEGKNAALREVPEAKIHDYSKSPRAGRKVGHVVVVGDRSEDLLGRASRAAGLMASSK